MRKKRKDIPFIILLVLGWFICTVLCMFVGYCITGAIPETNIEKHYFERFLKVATSPFDGYFNEYTPVGMILGFIICEIVFGMIIYLMNQKKKVLDVNLMDSYLGEKENDPDLEFIFLDKNLEDDCENLSVKEVKMEKLFEEEAQQEESEVELMLQEETFLELFSNGYSMQQITEMMELTKYIKSLDVLLLKKMFKVTMSPEDIRRYIESFYG